MPLLLASRQRISTLVLVTAFVVASACNKPVSKDVAAVVNGRTVTYRELDRAIASQFQNTADKSNPDSTVQLRLEALRALVDNEILFQRAEKAGLLASDADVDAKISELRAPHTQEEFQKLLGQKKMSTADLRIQVRRELSIQKLMNKEIGSHISISDADVSAFYNANKASFNLPESKVRLAQILVTAVPSSNVNNLKNDKAQNDSQARSKIQMIERRLKQGGEEFASLAQQYSEDPETAPSGGDLGFVPESTLDRANPDLRKLIVDMTPGQVSQVIHTPEGYRLIKMITRVPAGQRELSDPRVQEEIRQGLFQGREQALRLAFYEVARSEAKVVNYYALSVLQSRDQR